jgi:dTDP-4-dehydrorhamnose 3,5-epimerase
MDTLAYRRPAIHQMKIHGCLLIVPSIHHDSRGQIQSLFNEHYNLGNFVEDKISISGHHVLRGFHGDFLTGKLVSCLDGSASLTVADMRKESPTYGKWETTLLSGSNRHEIYIPPGVLNAHLCLAPQCTFWYKLTAGYAGENSQITVRWNDQFLSVNWPVTRPILSPRDANAPDWKDIDFTRCRRKSTVAVSGYFNPLHSGHLNLIAEAKKFGDNLTVIVNNDRQVALKGGKLFMAEDERMALVRQIRGVDDVVLSIDDDNTVSQSIAALKPDIFANGGDVTEGNFREAEVCGRLGIMTMFGVGGAKTQSSSRLLNGV